MFPLRVRLAAAAIGVLMTACSGDRVSSRSTPPPRAEFLLGAADSTFWVATTSGEIRVRGAPLVLAKFDGRYFEVYAHHQDLSYPDADLLGDRLYRRDLLTGDSTLVFADTVVPRMAREYAAAHPDERPLGPDEEGEADPATSIVAEVDVLDVFGPYLSYEYHLDVALPGKQPWHATRQGVIDLRTAREASVADLFGRDAGARLTTQARQAFGALRDSIVRERPSMSEEDRRAAGVLERLRFDESSFTLSSSDGRLAVNFSLPGRGEGPAGNAVELEPLSVDSVPWWKGMAAALPTGDDAGNDRWHGKGYQVVARYDTSGEVARVSLADSANREWPVAAMQSPLFQIMWLDNPRVPDAERKALTRAFNHAASYDEGARVASTVSSDRSRILHLVTRHATQQTGSGKPGRNVRPHDARTCEQLGPCVRRRGAVDDGQVRGDRRLSSLPRQRRDGIDRPRGFSRTDPLERSRRNEVERQLRRTNVHGGWRSRGGRGPADGSPAAHKLLLFDVRCR